MTLAQQHRKHIREMACKAAFYDHSWCPGTSFWEVNDQSDTAIRDLVATANEHLAAAGQGSRLLGLYEFAQIIWNMNKQEVDDEMLEAAQ